MSGLRIASALLVVAALVGCEQPAEDQAHQPDEFIEAGELERCVGVLRGLVNR